MVLLQLKWLLMPSRGKCKIHLSEQQAGLFLCPFWVGMSGSQNLIPFQKHSLITKQTFTQVNSPTWPRNYSHAEVRQKKLPKTFQQPQDCTETAVWVSPNAQNWLDELLEKFGLLKNNLHLEPSQMGFPSQNKAQGITGNLFISI